MGAKRRQYTKEFKLEAVRLAKESKKPLSQVARELGIRADMLRAWNGRWRVSVARMRSRGTERCRGRRKRTGDCAGRSRPSGRNGTS